jgi:hypothetical protein
VNGRGTYFVRVRGGKVVEFNSYPDLAGMIRARIDTDSAQIEGNIIGISIFRRPRATQSPIEERGV